MESSTHVEKSELAGLTTLYSKHSNTVKQTLTSTVATEYTWDVNSDLSDMSETKSNVEWVGGSSFIPSRALLEIIAHSNLFYNFYHNTYIHQSHYIIPTVNNNPIIGEQQCATTLLHLLKVRSRVNNYNTPTDFTDLL